MGEINTDPKRGRKKWKIILWSLVGGVVLISAVALAANYAGLGGARALVRKTAAAEPKLEVKVIRALPDANAPIPPEMQKLRYYFYVKNVSSERIEGINVNFPIPFGQPHFKKILSMSSACRLPDREVIVCNWPKGGTITLDPGQMKDFFVVLDTVPPLPCDMEFQVRAWAEGVDSRKQSVRVESVPLDEKVQCEAVVPATAKFMIPAPEEQVPAGMDLDVRVQLENTEASNLECQMWRLDGRVLGKEDWAAGQAPLPDVPHCN